MNSLRPHKGKNCSFLFLVQNNRNSFSHRFRGPKSKFRGSARDQLPPKASSSCWWFQASPYLWLHHPLSLSLHGLLYVSIKTLQFLKEVRALPHIPAHSVAIRGLLPAPTRASIQGSTRVLSSCICVVQGQPFGICLLSLPISLELVDFISSIWFYFFQCGWVLCRGGRRQPSYCPILGKGARGISVGMVSVLALQGGQTLHSIKSCIIYAPILLEFLF